LADDADQTAYVAENKQQAAYESCKPLTDWLDNLAKKVDFFSSWWTQLGKREHPSPGCHANLV